MTVKTRNAGYDRNTHPSMFKPETLREVVVDGVVVGHYGRNKHGITIGHCDPQGVAAARQGKNPFIYARDICPRQLRCQACWSQLAPQGRGRGSGHRRGRDHAITRITETATMTHDEIVQKARIAGRVTDDGAARVVLEALLDYSGPYRFNQVELDAEAVQQLLDRFSAR